MAFSSSAKKEPSPLFLSLIQTPSLLSLSSAFIHFLHFPLIWCSSHSSSLLSFRHVLSLSHSLFPFTFPHFRPIFPLSRHDLVSSRSQRRHLGFGSRAREGMTPLLGDDDEKSAFEGVREGRRKVDTHKASRAHFEADGQLVFDGY